MRKFKCIKEYPGSPKLGTTLNYTGHVWDDNNQIRVSLVESSTFLEFWKEVIEKNYEILTWYSPSGRLENRIHSTCDSFHTQIHSIKRLSDGEIFTIGDKLTYGKISSIKSINNSNKLWLDFKSSGGEWNIKNMIKSKQPLFITEDGVNIFEGDIYYVVAKKDIYESTIGSEYEIKAFELEENDKTFKQYNWNNFWSFSTKEKAEEYILMNQKSLSIDDVLEVWSALSGNTKESLMEKSTLMSRIIEFVKLK